jgi:hypothetical protein
MIISNTAFRKMRTYRNLFINVTKFMFYFEEPQIRSRTLSVLLAVSRSFIKYCTDDSRYSTFLRLLTANEDQNEVHSLLNLMLKNYKYDLELSYTIYCDKYLPFSNEYTQPIKNIDTFNFPSTVELITLCFVDVFR